MAAFSSGVAVRTNIVGQGRVLTNYASTALGLIDGSAQAIGNKTLLIKDGGRVINHNGHIGWVVGSYANSRTTNHNVVVTGNGSEWVNLNNLYVGGMEPGTATSTNDFVFSNSLTATDGGRVAVGGNLYVGYLGHNARAASVVSNSAVNVQAGGVLNAGNVFVGWLGMNADVTAAIGGHQFNIAGGTATVGVVNVLNGALNVSDGVLWANSVVATNGANSLLNLSAGTLSALTIDHNNGSALTGGDGSGATATLNLRDGGTVNAANGLVLADDAVLDIGSSVGAASVTGDVTFNSGTEWVLDWTGTHTGDVLTVDGSVGLGGTLTVNFGYTPALFDKLTNLVVLSGYAAFGDFDTVQWSGGSLPGNWYVTFNKTGSDDIGYLEVIPEPSAMTLVGFALAITAVVLRRRR